MMLDEGSSDEDNRTIPIARPFRQGRKSLHYCALLRFAMLISSPTHDDLLVVNGHLFSQPWFTAPNIRAKIRPPGTVYTMVGWIAKQ
jgi:hypothetical protein